MHNVRCTATLLLLIPLVMRAQVLTGDDVLLRSRLDILSGKRVGVVANQASRLRSGDNLVDALVRHGVNVTVIFAPEHGFRGVAGPGVPLSDTIDLRTRIPISSLYGRTTKPTDAMLGRVDVLVYDLQDVGVRFYTYTSTMYLVMEAAADRHIPVVVLDRPDPLGGEIVDGPILSDSLRSFLGMMPLPVVYGLTCGELARMIVGEHWLGKGREVDLTVIPMEGWKRRMSWDETKLPWFRPSPNMPSPRTCLAYPVTCFLEATNVSEGRGTDSPFETIGAPFIDADSLVAALRLECPEIGWEPASFTPRSSKYRDTLCHGVRLRLDSVSVVRPVECGLFLVRILMRLCPRTMEIRKDGLDRLAGSFTFFQSLSNHARDQDVLPVWEKGAAEFARLSKRYRLYP